MAKMKLSHNLSDVQLEETLEKALKGLRPYTEPNRDFPDKLANNIKSEAGGLVDKVFSNMLAEIQEVLQAK